MLPGPRDASSGGWPHRKRLGHSHLERRRGRHGPLRLLRCGGARRSQSLQRIYPPRRSRPSDWPRLTASPPSSMPPQYSLPQTAAHLRLSYRFARHFLATVSLTICSPPPPTAAAARFALQRIYSPLRTLIVRPPLPPPPFMSSPPATAAAAWAAGSMAEKLNNLLASAANPRDISIAHSEQGSETAALVEALGGSIRVEQGTAPEVNISVWNGSVAVHRARGGPFAHRRSALTERPGHIPRNRQMSRRCETQLDCSGCRGCKRGGGGRAGAFLVETRPPPHRALEAAAAGISLRTT